MARRRQLIVADDYRPFVEVCRALLEPEFEVVDVAFNGQEVLAKASLHRPDVVILDVFMPVMNGLYAAEHIKQKYPEIQLIFLTADPRPAIREAAMERGASAVIIKGDAEELRTALRSCARTGSPPQASLASFVGKRIPVEQLLK